MAKTTFEFDIHAWAREMKGRSTDAQLLWLYMLMFMYMTSKADGTLPPRATAEALCEKASLTPKQYEKALKELEEHRIFSRDDKGVIYSRRMRREHARMDADAIALKTVFDTLVDHYPNATLVNLARGEWQRLCLDGTITAANAGKVLEGLDRWKASRQWREDDGKYVPSLNKWLAEKRWWDHPQQDATAAVKHSRKGTDPMAVYDPNAKD